MKTQQTLLRTLFVLSLLLIASSKVVRKTWSIKNFQNTPKWNYITKFVPDLGSSLYDIRARLVNPPSTSGDKSADVYLNIVIDDQWENFERKWNENSIEACKSQNQYGIDKKRIQIPSNGEWGSATQGAASQSVKNHVWYFIVNDCKGNLVNDLGAEDHWKIQFEFDIINADRSHLSFDQQGFLLPYFLLYIGSFLFLSQKGKQFYESYTKEEEIDYPFLLGLISLLFQNGSFLLEMVHLYYFKTDGQGILFFQVFSKIAAICSQFTITVFLVLISWGWTLTYRKL